MNTETGAWMRGNLTTQGYCLTDAERRELAVALRFSTGACLGFVIGALILESAALCFALAVVGLVAGFTPRHPFDYVWNGAVRHLVGGPALPVNPPYRRHAFKVATVWLATVGLLFLVNAPMAATVLGAMLVTACTTTTATNLCLPSETLAWIERRQARKSTITI